MKEDSIQKAARERAINYWYNNPQMKTFKMENLDGEQIKCHDCGEINFKLHSKYGGQVIKKRRKIISENPLKFLYVCKCGSRITLADGEFKHSKLRYGCSAGVCPFGKKKMDKDCISCKYIFEK